MSTGNNGIIRLAQANIDLIRNHAPEPESRLVLGIIDVDLGLALDDFAIKYSVFEYLLLDNLGVVNPPQLVDLAGTLEPHSHGVSALNTFKPLSPGDRVLVAVTNKGTIPVVIGRVKMNLILNTTIV